MNINNCIKPSLIYKDKDREIKEDLLLWELPAKVSDLILLIKTNKHKLKILKLQCKHLLNNKEICLKNWMHHKMKNLYSLKKLQRYKET